MNKSLKTELIAGTTSFFAISYIIIVNPLILHDAAVPLGIGVVATIVASVVGCLIMGLWGRAPLIITPGMGVNAFFTYTMVQTMGFTWHQALAMSLVASCAYVLLAFSPVIAPLRTIIPDNLKHGITAGIGLFLVMIGLEKGGIIQSGGSRSLVTIGNLAAPVAWVTLLGLVLTVILYLRQVPGAFILGIAAAALMANMVGVHSTQVITLSRSDITAWHNALTQLDFSGLAHPAGWLTVFSLTLILVFESLGLIEGILPVSTGFKHAFQAGAVATIIAAFAQSSPTVAAAESASGIQVGGKTGKTALTAAGWFAVAFVAVPLLRYIPTAAIAPVIIITGAMMMQQLAAIDFDDLTEWLPAFFIVVLIPLTNSISSGLAFGFISYPVVKTFSKTTAKVHWALWLLAAIFAVMLVVESIH